MQTLQSMIAMLRQPGDNVIDNETLYRLLQVDGAYANAVLERQHWLPYIQRCNQLVKLLRNYNPEFPMGDGMYAQFRTLMEEMDNGGRSGHGTAEAGRNGLGVVASGTASSEQDTDG